MPIIIIGAILSLIWVFGMWLAAENLDSQEPYNQDYTNEQLKKIYIIEHTERSD